MKNKFQKSRNIRIFISSTFQDMQSERDMLVTKVFPRLRQIAYERNVTLTEVDLRWGITEEEAKSSKVVEICLDEIRNSHPFFIGLLGERYGWCPSKETLIEHQAMPDRYEWLAADLDRGMSITEIEIQYGVLRSLEPVYASFYIRKTDEKTIETDPRQAQLKETVRNNKRYNTYDYCSPEQLGEQVESEFKTLLDHLFPKNKVEDPTVHERQKLQAFLDDKSDNYIPNKAYISYLDKFLNDTTNQHLVITGESGMGKSALLAYWLKNIMEDGRWNVVAHFSANSSQSLDTTDIAKHITTQIDSLYGLEQMEENDRQIEHNATDTDNIDYTHDKYTQPLGYVEQNEGLVWKAINMEGHPSEPIFNPDGTLTHSGARSVGGLVTGNNWIKRTTKTLKNTTTLNITMLDNKLRFTGDFSFRTKDFIEDKKTTAVPYSDYEGVIKYLGVPETDDKMLEKVQQTTYISTNIYAEYENTFAGKHYLKALAGYNYEQQDYKAISSERNGLLMPDVENINFAMGDNMSIKSDGNRWRYAGAFFRLNYSYDNRYLFEVNGRYDGSSKFPNNSQWGFFPSASAAWRFSEEKFWKVNPAIISHGKLRVSYGALGNSNVRPYSYLEKFALKTYSTTGSSSEGRYLDGKAQLRYTLNPDQIPDNIGWETSRTIDGGIDLGFWNNKITLSADYYVRKTANMYTVGPTLPDTFGASSPKGNYADMSTYGYEISLGYNDSFRLAGKPFSFGIKATLADYHSVIDKYNNPKRDLDDYYVGQRIGEIWGFVCNGLFQSQDEIDAAFDGKGYKNNLMQTSVNYITYPGDMRFEDLNNTGTIDNGANTVDSPGDRKIIGNSEPRYIYTLSFSADWNNFFLSAMFDGVGKQDWYPSGESSFWGQYNRPYNQVPVWHLNNYWTKDRPDAYLPRYSGYYNPLYKGTANTRYLQDVSYFRLKNLQFGYNLPKKWIAKAGFSKVSVYFSGENLWSWSPLYRHTKDYDVTVITKGSDNDLTSGNKGDGFNYPTMRNLSLGISITY